MFDYAKIILNKESGFCNYKNITQNQTPLHRNIEMKKVTPVSLLFVLLITASLHAELNVLIYGDYSNRAIDKLSPSSKINAVEVTNANQITSELLSDYDVFFACTSFTNDLDSKGTIISDFLQSGGGVIIGQSNQDGPINWLPSGLEVTVATRSYPESSHGYFNLTESGATHEIFSGLSTSDLGTRPLDTVYTYDISSAWDVLSVHSSDSNILGLAVGQYNGSRLVLWPDNINASSIKESPNLAMIENTIEWAAVVPEPASLILLAFGAAAIRKRNT